jgi:hypothetical protein
MKITIPTNAKWEAVPTTPFLTNNNNNKTKIKNKATLIPDALF